MLQYHHSNNLDHWEFQGGIGVWQENREVTFRELAHLEGEEVQILADGYRVPDQIVNGGKIVLERPATTVTVGLPYESEIETVNLEAATQQGTSQGKTKRISKVGIRQHRTLGLELGYVRPPDASLTQEAHVKVEYENIDPVYLGPPVMNKALPLFSGDIRVPFDGGYDLLGRFRVLHRQPLPARLIALMPEYRVR